MKLRILAFLLALLTVLSTLTLAGCSQNDATGGTETAAETEEKETKEKETEKNEIPEYEGVDWINAAEFGFVGDGKTANDLKMKEYIKYYSKTPIYFSEGVYCFEQSIDFPQQMYIELDPHAELKCTAKTPLEFFITVRKDAKNWCAFDEYTKSYIKGGTINANYKAKVGLAVCQNYHSQFEGFMLKNVLEKGIQTWYNTNDLRDGSFIGRDLTIYNDQFIAGTIGIYDAHYDTNVYETSVVNFETAIYTYGGRFYECTAWVNSIVSKNASNFGKITFAEVAGGTQTIFDNCTVDTMRFGFKLADGASCTINNFIWFTNTNFYSAEIQKKYPRTIFWCANPSTAQIYVVGAQVPNEGNLYFSNGELPLSRFLNVRVPGDATNIPYFRNDTDQTEKPSSTATTVTLDGSTSYDEITAQGNYVCDLTKGANGANKPPFSEKGVLEVVGVGDMVIQRFVGTTNLASRIFDGTRWGEWIDASGKTTVVKEVETVVVEQKPAESNDFYGTDWINAVKFGFVGDGRTANDAKMKEYIRKYSDTPIYFPGGVYCFEQSIDFPKQMYIELDPNAELKCTAKTPLEFFITVRKDAKNWCAFDEYTKSYIKGGTINANYKAKVGLAVCQNYHSQFEGFMLKNVLEKGIQTWYNTNDLRDGSFIGRDLTIYNDQFIAGTIGIYDAHYDTNVYETSVVNFETAIYTYGGRFYECTAWVNSIVSKNASNFGKITFAEVAGGTQTIFDNCTVDTMRFGFKLADGASCTINNFIWFTNTNFYSAEIQKKYPRTIFWCANPSTAQIYVVGAQIPGEANLAFSNAALPKSVFMNIRATGSTSQIAYFRNDK